MEDSKVSVGMRVDVDVEGCHGPGEVIGMAWKHLIIGWIILLDEPLPSGDRGVCLTSSCFSEQKKEEFLLKVKRWKIP